MARPTMPPTATLPEGEPLNDTLLPSSPTVRRRMVAPFTQPNRPASGYLSRSTVQAMFLMVYREPSTLCFSGEEAVPMGTHSLMDEASISAVNFTSPSIRYWLMEYPSSPLTARAKPSRSSAEPIPRLMEPPPAACFRVISAFLPSSVETVTTPVRSAVSLFSSTDTVSVEACVEEPFPEAVAILIHATELLAYQSLEDNMVKDLFSPSAITSAEVGVTVNDASGSDFPFPPHAARKRAETPITML